MVRAAVTHLGSWSWAAAMQHQHKLASTLGRAVSRRLMSICRSFLGKMGRTEQAVGLKLGQFE